MSVYDRKSPSTAKLNSSIMSKQLVESDVKLAHSFTINLLYLIIVSIAARAMVAVSEL